MNSSNDVIAYHVTFGTYGFWLPNDPRGSFSTEVRASHLRPFGPATKVEHRASVAERPHDHALRRAAKRSLTRPEVFFSEQQVTSVASGFAAQIAKSGYQVFACSILQQHVHLVLTRHRYAIEQVVRLMRQAATLRLLQDGLHPFANQRSAAGNLPSVWEQDFWKVFLYSYDDVLRVVGYVEENCDKAGQPRQSWPFVTRFVP